MPAQALGESQACSSLSCGGFARWVYIMSSYISLHYVKLIIKKSTLSKVKKLMVDTHFEMMIQNKYWAFFKCLMKCTYKESHSPPLYFHESLSFSFFLSILFFAHYVFFEVFSLNFVFHPTQVKRDTWAQIFRSKFELSPSFLLFTF